MNIHENTMVACSHKEWYSNESHSSHDHVGHPRAQVVVDDEVVDIWPHYSGQESKERLQCRQNGKHGTWIEL